MLLFARWGKGVSRGGRVVAIGVYYFTRGGEGRCRRGFLLFFLRSVTVCVCWGGGGGAAMGRPVVTLCG